MKNNIIEQKSFAFAVRIVNTCLTLKESKHYALANQLLKSGTSIGANIAEGVHAQSLNDFIHKLSISQKESNETNFWIRLLQETQILQVEESQQLLNECEEIQRILSAIIKTTKKKYN